MFELLVSKVSYIDVAIFVVNPLPTSRTGNCLYISFFNNNVSIYEKNPQQSPKDSEAGFFRKQNYRLYLFLSCKIVWVVSFGFFCQFPY